MNLTDLDLNAAQNLSWGAIGISVVIALVALKFAGSLVTKLLFVAGASAVGVVAFGQRDDLNACAALVREAAEQGLDAALEVECTFFGQTVRVPDSLTGG